MGMRRLELFVLVHVGADEFSTKGQREEVKIINFRLYLLRFVEIFCLSVLLPHKFIISGKNRKML